ncbi:MAG: hypothetical protein DCE90_00870 [Pseudanabaena sp.]|nr:MAG: hypothetical protein DCE90_00870 [Pseudanabaena sp.]
MTENANKDLTSQVVKKDKPNESTTLNRFRETIKDVLEEITTLEVNTIIVRRISIDRYDARTFYEDLLQKLAYETEEGLQDVKRSLIERNTELKQKGSAISPLELERYNRDLETYRLAERKFNERKNSDNPIEIQQFEREQSCFKDLSNKVLKLDIPKDERGRIITDAPMIRYFRTLWEFEQMVLNGEQVYAQTKFQLDGDLTNRFNDDLFAPARSKIEPKVAQLILDIHQKALINAEGQWTRLIETCVNLIKDLIPYRIQ